MRRDITVDRIINSIQAILTIVSGLAMIITTIVIVLWRYVLNAPLTWGEEAARYLAVWFIYIGVAVAAQRRGHLGVEAFTMLLPRKAQKIISCIADLLTVLILLFLAYCSVLMSIQYSSTNQVSTILQIPMVVVYCIVPITLVVSVYHYIKSMIKAISNMRMIPSTSESEED